MPLPQEIVFVRHGRSRSNEAQAADKRGEDMAAYADVFDIHDFEQRLAPEGVKQAKKAGRFMLEHELEPAGFDGRYVSPFLRTMETAAYLGNDDCDWLPEIRLIERDWGHYGATTIKERQERFPDTEKMKGISPFFARYDGGESINDVIYRFRDWIGTLAREMPDKRVLAVTHGEMMWAARFVMERMLPQEWQAMDKDKTQRIGNCAILQYSRLNPEDPNQKVVASMSDGWRRMIDPIQPKRSPYNGEWQKLPGKKYHDSKQLLELVENTSFPG